MANKKINELDSRASLSLSDLMAVGDPSTGYLYKTTISDLKTLTGAGVISFNGRFGAVSPAEGDYTLTQLGDVIITSATNAQLLQFNGSNWVNWTPNYLTAESDTLNSVTGRGNTTANGITVGSVSAAGLSNLLGQLRTFTTTGNVYIGASPSSAADAGYKLDLNGTARISGDMTMWDDGTNNGNSRALIFRALGSTGNVQTGQIILDGFGVAGQDQLQLSASSIRLAPASGSVTITGTTPNISTVAASGFRLNANSTTNGFIFTQAYNQTSGDLLAVFTNSNQKRFSVSHAGVVTIADLAGTGSRMVVTDANGVLSTQAIPSLTGYVPYTGATANVNLGTYRLTTSSPFIDNVGSGGCLNFKIYNTGDDHALNNSNYLSVYALGGSDVFFSFNNAGVKKRFSFNTGNLAADTTRYYMMPNADGTFALTSQLHDAVTIGTANGLSLSGQALSLALASTSATGALSSTDWNTFNGKQAALSGTGFVKISGTTISYDNSTYLTTASAASTYVPYTGATGSLFLGNNDLESKFVFIEGDGSLGGILSFKQYASSWQSTTDHTNIYATGTNKLNFSFFQTGGGGKFFNFDVSSLGSTGRTYTMPDASGTLALTSNIPTVAGVYLPLAGGVLTGKLAGVNLEFSNPSATFVSGGVNNSISSHIIAVPSGSTWSNGAAFSASNNTQMLSFGGSQSIQNGAIVAGTVNVNRISFTAGSATVTMAQSTGIRAMAGMQMLQQTGGTINGTVSHGASMMVQGVYPTNTANVTFTNYYGVLINPLDEWGGVTFGSRYGIYQAGSSDANFFAGNVGIGTSSPGAPLDVWRNGTNGLIASFTDGVSSNLQIRTTSTGTLLTPTTDTYLAFGSNNTERMRITSGGDLALGTSTVSWAGANRRVVEINGTSQVLIGIKVGDVQKGYIYHNGTNLYTENSHSGGDWYLAQVGAGNMIFSTNGSERMRIMPGGNVGINTTSANERLQINNTLSLRSGNPALWGSFRFGTTDVSWLDAWAGIESDNEAVGVNVSNLRFYTSFGVRNERMRITAGGNFFVYSMAASAGTNAVRFNTSTGQVTYDTSSARYKDNIRESVYGLKDVLKLRSAMFEYKEDQRSDIGLIAEELYPVIPELVGLDKKGKPDSVSYDRMVSVLVKAIQELKTELDTLKAK